MGVQNLFQMACLKVITTILQDGKTIRNTELITLQIRKIVGPVMEAIFKGDPRVYRAMLAIMAGVAHMRVRISIPVKPVTDQLQPVQIVIIPAGAARTAKNMPQILITAKRATERT